MVYSAERPVLLVEDFTPVIRIYRHYLKQVGLKHVESAANGAEALERLQTKRYALIISDWHMEPITGFQLLQRVRADPLHADMPFVLATIESREAYVRAARNAGVSEYLLKPFNAATLRSALANACPKIGAAMEPPMGARLRDPSDRFALAFNADALAARPSAKGGMGP